MDPLDGLNPEQRRAAEAVRGPVCILAGAGSGKTTTITRRIAQQVASGAFEPTRIMAVTFTDKAAGELRGRLAALGVQRVRAGTFHSAALRQLRHFAPERVGRILPRRRSLLRQIANTLPAPFKFRPAGDLATEIEWAKNRRIPVERYRAEAEGREPPIPIDLMHRVFREYERRKEAEGLIDFEDLLELTLRLFEENAQVRDTFRAQYRAFTVDEYQDVNLLQQQLLEHWLGDGDDLCVVGDDYQSIYAFTGAGPEHLLDVPRRYPHALVIRLEENYRSTPQVLELANRLVPKLGGAEKVLRPTLDDGPEPVVRAFATADAEGAAIAAEIRTLGAPYQRIAILARTNARLTDFEELLHDAHIPFQGASLLERDAARRLLRRLERVSDVDAEEAVRAAALDAGWLVQLPDKLGEREVVRQTDLARLVSPRIDLRRQRGRVRRRPAPPLRLGRRRREGRAPADAASREGARVRRRLPATAGREGAAVRQARTPAEIAEERRLLYVGMTRAKQVLWLTWSSRPSRFLEELGIAAVAPLGDPKPKKGKFVPTAGSDGLYHELAVWRRARAEEDEVPPYVVFDNKTLDAIARTRPRTLHDLASLPGVGPVKLERYGDQVLAVVGRD